MDTEMDVTTVTTIQPTLTTNKTELVLKKAVSSLWIHFGHWGLVFMWWSVDKSLEPPHFPNILLTAKYRWKIWSRKNDYGNDKNDCKGVWDKGHISVWFRKFLIAWGKLNVLFQHLQVEQSVPAFLVKTVIRDPTECHNQVLYNWQ